MNGQGILEMPLDVYYQGGMRNNRFFGEGNLKKSDSFEY